MQVIEIPRSDSFKELQTGFLNDINDDNLTENFQNVLPMIEYSDNFKKRQADLPFFLSNDNNDNHLERFKTALILFPNEVERNDNLKELTCSQNYYMGPSQEVIDIEPQNYMDVEFQENIDKELSQESSELENTTHIKVVDTFILWEVAEI
ncbi:hypothetical protein C2G38_2179510 [Gigaspora rosea]|uniref:Uncharacterized protein n=1 Tax=Gigaspora rosea TaxID=44941 RepID=A0A397VEU5_9GLOM|nr:hypothetical protein C2G38_2179510 [Gigaspora rosea]